MKLLIITESFPPEFAPRMGYLCKWLQQNTSWIVNVVSEKRDGIGTHSRTFSHLQGFINKKYEFLYEDGVHKFSWKDVFKVVCIRKLKGRRWCALILSKIKYIFVKRAFDFDAKRAIKMAAIDGPYDVILCSATANGVHRLGDYAAKLLKIPIIQDVRDVEEQRFTIGTKLPRYILNNRAIRTAVFAKATKVVVTAQQQGELLKRLDPLLNLQTIYNGYDPDVFEPLEPISHPTFDVVYVGAVYLKQNMHSLQKFLKALRVFRSLHNDSNDIRVLFYSTQKTFQDSIVPIMQKEEVYCVERVEPVEQKELKGIFERTSVLLKFSNVGSISTKLYEYLAVNRPILSIRENVQSEDDEILLQSGAGSVAYTIEDILNFLEVKYSEWKNSGYTRGTTDLEYISRFSRAKEAEEYEQLFNKVLKDVE